MLMDVFKKSLQKVCAAHASAIGMWSCGDVVADVYIHGQMTVVSVHPPPKSGIGT